jgi:hypothetical protein
MMSKLKKVEELPSSDKNPLVGPFEAEEEID